jgi:hypothetical protein
MNGQSESEQLQNFHVRLSQWVSSQGFWFQLRYSMSGSGGKGSFGYHLLRLFMRISVFVIVVGIGIGVFLVRQTGTQKFQADVRTSLQEKLGAEEIQVRGFAKEQGKLNISRMAVSGGENTFFTGMKLMNLKCRMGLLDGFSKVWDPGQVTISRMDLALRAGADSEASSKAIAKVLFQDTGRLALSSIEVADMSLRWGYSERTRGEIIGSKMIAQRIETGWRLKFRGGTFSQNWLKRLQIEQIDVVFGEKGIIFEEMILRKGEGYLTLVNGRVAAGQRPEVSGLLKLRKVELSSLLPAVLRDYVEGTISGEFRVFGSTNSSDGVGFEGDVLLEGEDVVVVRDRVPILKALSVVDAFNNYRRIDFRSGSFNVRTHGGKFDISDVIIASESGASLKGKLSIRYPTPEEAIAMGQIEIEGSNYGDGILSDDELNDKTRITLEGAAKTAGGKTGFDAEESDSLFDRLGLNLENRRLEERATERLSRSYRYEGDFILVLPGDVFVRAPKLEEKFPAVNGKIFLDVPINGFLHELTQKQSDQIYELGGR